MTEQINSFEFQVNEFESKTSSMHKAGDCISLKANYSDQRVLLFNQNYLQNNLLGSCPTIEGKMIREHLEVAERSGLNLSNTYKAFIVNTNKNACVVNVELNDLFDLERDAQSKNLNDKQKLMLELSKPYKPKREFIFNFRPILKSHEINPKEWIENYRNWDEDSIDRGNLKVSVFSKDEYVVSNLEIRLKLVDKENVLLSKSVQPTSDAKKFIRAVYSGTIFDIVDVNIGKELLTVRLKPRLGNQ